jgi:hypothetical protein
MSEEMDEPDEGVMEFAEALVYVREKRMGKRPIYTFALNAGSKSRRIGVLGRTESHLVHAFLDRGLRLQAGKTQQGQEKVCVSRGTSGHGGGGFDEKGKGESRLTSVRISSSSCAER